MFQARWRALSAGRHPDEREVRENRQLGPKFGPKP
jgi:hypothetical protein